MPTATIPNIHWTSYLTKSNRCTRKGSAYKGLAKVGFRSDLFDDIVTSGELTFELIKNRKYDFLSSKEEKLKVFVIGNGEDDSEYADDCLCEIVSLEEASFVLARGMFEINGGGESIIRFGSPGSLLASISSWLTRARERGMYRPLFTVL